MNKLSHALIWLIGKKVLWDAEEHIRILQKSPLDWVVVRSPILTSNNANAYKLSKELAPPYYTISRYAVARCLVDLVKEKESGVVGIKS